LRGAPEEEVVMIRMSFWGSSMLALSLGISIAVASSAHAETTNLGGYAYAELCNRRGVPLPYTWGGIANSGWNYGGTFSQFYSGSLNFDTYVPEASMNGGGNVYYHVSQSPPGVCVVLQHTGNPFNLDVICQGASGKACFWEKAHMPPVTEPHNLVDLDPNTEDWLYGGAEMNDPAHPSAHCTECHAGENAFITHYGSTPKHALDLVAAAAPYWTVSNWYDPIMPADWARNLGPAVFTSSVPGSTSSPACLSCHASSNVGRFPMFTDQLNGNFQHFLVQQLSNRPSSRTGMPPGNGCTPDYNCAWQLDPFVQWIDSSATSAPHLENLALGQNAFQSTIASPGDPWRATDGVEGANWYSDGFMAHTLNDGNLPLNNSFNGTWVQNPTGINTADGALVGVGSSVFGIQGNTPKKFDFGTQSWQSTNLGGVQEISMSANNVLWGVTLGAVFRYNPTINNWDFVSSQTMTHIAAGDGTHPWAINGQNLYRWNGSSWDLKVVAPWVTNRSCGTAFQISQSLVQVAVGVDEDPWIVDSVGNVFHLVGGKGWIQANCDMGGVAQAGTVKTISVRNNRYAWAATTSPTGLFHWNPDTEKWQRNCPTSGCAAPVATFRTVSVGLQDSSVWAVNTQGGVFQADESLLVDRNDPTTVNNSLVAITGPGNGVYQVAAVGGGGTSLDGNVFVTRPDGVSFRLNNYSGKLPLNGKAWWKVDLGAYYHVDHIKIFNRDDGLSNRLSSFRIAYSTGTDQGPWALGSDQTLFVGTSSNLAIPINVNFNTRYVMIQKVGQDYLTLAEVEVWGVRQSVPKY
jgi:hypothetical protein